MTFKQLPRNVRFLLWLAGTLVVGALGNGLWELMKPPLVLASSAVLDVATLGLSSLRDSMYVEIARGTNQRAAERTLGVLTGLIAGIGVGLVLVPSAWKRLKDVAPEPAIRDLLGPARRVLGWLLIAMAGFLFIQHARVVYIVRAANHIEQLQRLCAPYLTEQQRLMFASRAAGMRTREEYVQMINELAAVATGKNIHVPEFDIY